MEQDDSMEQQRQREGDPRTEQQRPAHLFALYRLRAPVADQQRRRRIHRQYVTDEFGAAGGEDDEDDDSPDFEE